MEGALQAETQTNNNFLEEFLEKRDKSKPLYSELRQSFGFKSDQQVSRALKQFFKGIYHLEKALTCGRPSYLTPEDEKKFFLFINEQADILNSVATCQALALAYHLKSERQKKAAREAMNYGCKKIASQLLSESIEYPSRAWLNEFCKKRGYNVISARTLEDIRRQSIDVNQIRYFFGKFSEILDSTPPELLFNADETSLSTRRH